MDREIVEPPLAATEVLFVISTDPRASHRPAEAIRIAAGVGAGRRVRVSIYLHGPAVLALSEFSHELIESENYDRYWPILAEMEWPIYVQSSSPFLAEIGQTPLRFKELSDQELAILAAKHNYVTRF